MERPGDSARAGSRSGRRADRGHPVPRGEKRSQCRFEGVEFDFEREGAAVAEARMEQIFGAIVPRESRRKGRTAQDRTVSNRRKVEISMTKSGSASL